MLKTCCKFIFFSFLVFLCGCALIAVSAESIRKSGLTEESRKELLQEYLARFSDAVSLSEATRALAFASDNYKNKFRERLLKNKDKVKVIGNEVLLIEYEDGARKAEVRVKYRFYRIPVYVAEDKQESLVWVYDGGGVWKLDDIKPVKQEPAEDE